jgi:hypothetical protein
VPIIAGHKPRRNLTVSRSRPTQREYVRSAAVVAFAAVSSVNGQTVQRVAHFTIKEFLKGKLSKAFLEAPLVGKAENSDSHTNSYDVGYKYILFLREKTNSDAFEAALFR